MAKTAREESSVYGFGKYSEGLYTARKFGKLTKEYILWTGVLERCYSERIRLIKPSYADCTVSNNFLSFQYFAAWCQSQTGFNDRNFHLDKDILVKGNKLYSEDTCAFVPRELNIILTKRQTFRGSCVIGVLKIKDKDKFVARLTISGKRKYLGIFDTEVLAFNAYKLAKESYIRKSAEKFKNTIDQRVFNALMNYVVEITD